MANTRNELAANDINDNGLGAGKKAASRFATPVTETCKKCEKRVYDMEKLSAGPVIYHKTCFRCTHCNRVLSVGSYTIGDNKPYCQPHYLMLFKEKGKYDFSDRKQEARQVVEPRSPAAEWKKQDLTDGPVATRRQHTDTPDRKPLADIVQTSLEHDTDKRQFAGFANMRALFETPTAAGGGSATSPQKLSTPNDMTAHESVRSRMAKYAALQNEKTAASAAAKTPSLTSAAVAPPSQQQNRVHLYDDVTLQQDVHGLQDEDHHEHHHEHHHDNHQRHNQQQLHSEYHDEQDAEYKDNGDEPNPEYEERREEEDQHYGEDRNNDDNESGGAHQYEEEVEQQQRHEEDAEDSEHGYQHHEHHDEQREDEEREKNQLQQHAEHYNDDDDDYQNKQDLDQED